MPYKAPDDRRAVEFAMGNDSHATLFTEGAE
ncbi:hypothetical protein QFZ30_000329 [Arthrobacter pascens]|nr:hypothetical protein [Arthrobacter pascens]